MLRKEKSMTQKELASRLLVSDKAVSKWETGNSMLDIILLVPLADVLEVTVTELPECKRIEKTDSLDADRTDEIVKKWKYRFCVFTECRFIPDFFSFGKTCIGCSYIGKANAIK